jgi:hypothetical protein
MIEATYKTTGGRLLVAVTGEAVKEVFERVAKIQEAFDAEVRCGLCRATDAGCGFAPLPVTMAAAGIRLREALCAAGRPALRRRPHDGPRRAARIPSALPGSRRRTTRGGLPGGAGPVPLRAGAVVTCWER